MTKRLLTFVLAILLCFSLLPVTNAEEAELPFVEFTILSLDYPDGFDDYPLVKAAKEKFNCDFTVQQVAWDTWDETVRTYAATGLLPEVIAWYNLNYGEYKTWAEQGVFKALPDDMSAYPNLKANLDKMDVDECLFVDGKLYCSPKINNNQPVNHFKNYMTLYRRDWAEAMGLDYAAVQEVTFDEFLNFLRMVMEQDPGNVGEGLIGCNGETGGSSWTDMVAWFDQYVTEYYLDDDNTIKWGARDAEVLAGIKTVNAMYKEGLLYRDAYADTGNSNGEALFNAGRVAALPGNVAILEEIDHVTQLQTVVPEFQDEDLGVFAIRMPDGKFHLDQMGEYWAAFAFSGECRDEVMDRFLQIGDWLLEDEQVETYAYGVKGEDWDLNTDGSVVLNWTDADIVAGADKYYISGERAFQKFFMLEGCNLWLEGNPSTRDYLQNDLYLAYYQYLGEKEDAGEVVYYPTNYTLEFLSTPMKDQYGSFSGDIQNAIIQAVVADDPEASWNEFLESKAYMVDMVIEEMQAALS